MKGHIKLGAPGALRDYMLSDLRMYSKSPANQFAAKLATGAGDYGDLQNWSYWVMADWQAGVGKRDAEGGGFLYAESETRYPEELSLPHALFARTTATGSGYNDTRQANAALINGTILTVGTTQTIVRSSTKFDGAVANAVYVLLYLDGNSAITTTVTVAIYSDSSGLPNAALASTTITLDGKPGWRYFLAKINYTTSATSYHIVVYPTTAGDVLTAPRTSLGSANGASYNGSSWASADYGIPNAKILLSSTSPGTVSNIAYFNDVVYASVGVNLVKYSTSNALGWATVKSYATTITDLQIWGDTLRVGLGNATNHEWMSTGEAFTALAVPAKLLYQWNGYLWRAVQNDVYYSADGTTWTGPIQIGPDGYEVRGMAGLGDYLYVSTDEALYYVGYGDFVFGVTLWPQAQSTNGASMHNWQGVLYIAIRENLFRFDGNALLPMGPNLGEGLPADRSGDIALIASQNNWLYVGINPSDTTSGKATIWAYNGQGWHNMAVFPKTITLNSVSVSYAQSLKNTMYLGTNIETLFRLYWLADSANPVSSEEINLPSGWLETDWFFGGLKEVYKDFESVYVSGENLDSNHYVEIYWQDDDSTDWELLGAATADRQEARWSDYATRPNTRQLKLGLALYQKALGGDYPIIRAVRAKYHPMVSDWFRWSFPVLVADNQTMIDGAVNSYTAAQMRTHLDSMITRVPPLILEDLDGTQYEVKVVGCTIQTANYRHENGVAQFDSLYHLTVEQIRSGAYS